MVMINMESGKSTVYIVGLIELIALLAFCTFYHQIIIMGLRNQSTNHNITSQRIYHSSSLYRESTETIRYEGLSPSLLLFVNIAEDNNLPIPRESIHRGIIPAIRFKTRYSFRLKTIDVMSLRNIFFISVKGRKSHGTQVPISAV